MTRPFATVLQRLIWLCVAPLLLLALWLAWADLRQQEEAHLREAATLAGNLAAFMSATLAGMLM